MTDDREVLVEDLPESLRELQQLIGLPATMAIVKRWGGLRIKIPSRYHDDHQLVKVVGHEAMVKVVDNYAGCNLYIPRALTAILAMRNVDILTRLDNEVSASTLAREYNLTERQIWKIKQRPEAARVPRPEQHRLL